MVTRKIVRTDFGGYWSEGKRLPAPPPVVAVPVRTPPSMAFISMDFAAIEERVVHGILQMEEHVILNGAVMADRISTGRANPTPPRVQEIPRIMTRASAEAFLHSFDVEYSEQFGRLSSGFRTMARAMQTARDGFHAIAIDSSPDEMWNRDRAPTPEGPPVYRVPNPRTHGDVRYYEVQTSPGQPSSLLNSLVRRLPVEHKWKP